MELALYSDSLFESTRFRVSRRTFTGPPDNEQMILLQKDIEKVNSFCDGLCRIRLIRQNADKVFAGLANSYGLIKNAHAFVALTVPAQAKNPSLSSAALGFYGEQLVLQVTALGLGSCWVMGTFNKKAAVEVAKIEESETLLCVIPIGKTDEEYSLKEKLMKGFTSARKRKPFEKIIKGIYDFDKMPSWVRVALKTARIAPSAVNKQPWLFSIGKADNEIYVENTSKQNGVDVGIVMSHFSIGAQRKGVRGKWEFEQNNERWHFIKL